MQNTRRRISVVLAAGALLASAAACAGTVDGSALPVDGRTPTPPSIISTQSRTTTDPATTPGPADPVPSVDITTVPVTTGQSTTPRTRITLSTDPAPTEPRSSTVDPGPRGVPPVTEEYVRKKIGEEAGFTIPIDGVRTRIFTFTVVEIDPDMGKRCDDPSAVPSGAALIGVKIKYSIPKAFGSMGGELAFERRAFIVKGADGTEHRDTISAASTACLREGLLPTADFRAGDSGEGWLVLDSPSRYGLVQYDLSGPGTEESPTRGWEWIIPGS